MTKNNKNMLILIYIHLLTSHAISKSSTFVGILCERLPRTHIKRERNIINESLHFMTEIIFLYLSSDFPAIFCARCLWNIEHSLLIPQVVEKTNGEKCHVKCSYSTIVMSHFFFFVFFEYFFRC